MNATLPAEGHKGDQVSSTLPLGCYVLSGIVTTWLAFDGGSPAVGWLEFFHNRSSWKLE